MTSARIKDKVIGFIHGKDGKGDWILPWQHMGATCGPCDELTEFIKGLFKEEDEIALNYLRKALEKEVDEVLPKGTFVIPPKEKVISGTIEKAEKANKAFSHALNVYIDSLYCSRFEIGVTPKPSKLTKTNVTVIIHSEPLK